ncbi:MAG: helix-turn-helix transcriptional regulator [Sulfurimonas sp.]|nr:helix-turn-helix transcriptional regulator [Sulfurimonas sp.]
MIGGRIKDYREGKNLKVAAFAALIGISQGSLSDIENGKTKPSAETLVKIVRNTDIDPGWLLTGIGGGQQPVTTREPGASYQLPSQKDPLIRKMVSIMTDLDEEAKTDLIKMAKKEKRRLDLEREQGFHKEQKQKKGKENLKGGSAVEP